MNLKCVFFFSALLSCVEFGHPGLLPPSLPRPAAQSLHDVYDCVTQSGSPGVRVSVAQCVSYCEEDTLWMQAKIKEIITDLGAAQQCG